MAGGKKKKKPASNPARGFATTSIPSKQKSDDLNDVDDIEPAGEKLSAEAHPKLDPSALSNAPAQPSVGASTDVSPEEFERRLEESELQLLVEKHSQKTKRDANRQIGRLLTDKRLLRSQANNLNARKWFTLDLTDEMLEVIIAESRSPGQSSTDASLPHKLLSEEDLIVKLWTIQETLLGSGFSQEKVALVIPHILGIAQKITIGNKDSIWGLEESLEWLARECTRAELPDYETVLRRGLSGTKDVAGFSSESQSLSGMSTLNKEQTTVNIQGMESSVGRTDLASNNNIASSHPISTRTNHSRSHDSNIDPDELLPVWMNAKTKLFDLTRRNTQSASSQRGRRAPAVPPPSHHVLDVDVRELQELVTKIESDVLFDQYLADQEWTKRRVALEKAAAVKRAAISSVPGSRHESPTRVTGVNNGDVSREAERIGMELLDEENSDDDAALADLFANLPVAEVDPVSGKSYQVVNNPDGTKIKIRDFGKTTGVSPRRILEEACRARETTFKILYTRVSDSTFSNRAAIRVDFAKTQDVPFSSFPLPGIDFQTSLKSLEISMSTVSTPDSLQAEFFVATAALFVIFNASIREEKVFLRLPAAWRSLWVEFATLKREYEDSADREILRSLRSIVRDKTDREEEDGIVLTTAFKRRTALLTPNDTGDESGPEKSGVSKVAGEVLEKLWAEKSSTPPYQKILQSRMRLPMWSYKETVLSTIDKEQIVIICGETGCGKSTQVPSFILEHELRQGKSCKIYCTEPRRISAISLARRVSEELGERKSDLGTSRSLVGYAIRLENNVSKETRIVYATTGIVMRMLEGSTDLKEITHIVLDEVHERSIDSDFLLIILRKLMARRPDLKVILMSATVDADRFSKYLDGAPVLQVPGRTFPVTSLYLEDAIEMTGYSLDNTRDKDYIDMDDEPEVDEMAQYSASLAERTKALHGYTSRTRNTISLMDEYKIDFELIVELIATIATDERYNMFSKAILVFLPGIAEILSVNDRLLGHPLFRSNWRIYPLHSTIASDEQEAAFLVPPPGTRKIVLATNIAETGITIPDVTCVIDSGKHREMRFDERRQLSRLLETFISRANAKQRRGRAGRVQEGLCVHLFTKYRHDELMADQQTPEFLRLSLQDLAIRVKICKLGSIDETLGQALDPPSAKNIRRAIDALIDVRALTPGEDLTPLGHQLAKLPLDVFLGKLILLGSIFKCLDATITVAAILTSKSPFSAPFGQRSQVDTVRLAFKRGDSDILTVYNAYQSWKRVCTTTGSDFQYCKKNFLSPQTLSNIEDLKTQLVVAVVDSGFLLLTDAERSNLNRIRFSSRKRQFFDLPQRSNINSDNDLIVTSVIAWSFYPKLLVRDGKGWRNIANNQSIHIHPSSVNKGNQELGWLSYYHIMQAKQFYNAHETTSVQDFAIALLCGEVRFDMYAGVLILDGNRARFAVSDWKVMLVIKTLRSRLRDIMTRTFKNPRKALTSQQGKWLDIWQRIFTQEVSVTSRE